MRRTTRRNWSELSRVCWHRLTGSRKDSSRTDRDSGTGVDGVCGRESKLTNTEPGWKRMLVNLGFHPFRGGGPVLKERRASDTPSEAQASRAGRKPTPLPTKPQFIAGPDTPNRSLYNPYSRHTVYGGIEPDCCDSSQHSRRIKV
jgi:hypothetical protein